jgi:GH43 family beta-xylosidase
MRKCTGLNLSASETESAGVQSSGTFVCLFLAGITGFLSGCGSKIAPLAAEQEAALFCQNPSTINRIGDPFILKNPDGQYYCYATSSDRGFKAWRSADLGAWEERGLVFNAFGENQWASSDFWAPEVVFDRGKYYMFYSARWTEKKSLRIGAAVSDSPEGPFVDALGRPLFDFGYAVIDAHVFIDDDGKKYLYYVRDCSENVINGSSESHIYVVELADDLLAVKGEPVPLTKPEQLWESPAGGWKWNEGPFVVKNAGRYYLMYSGNFFANKSYSIGYAVSDSPWGPFVKYDKNPILSALPSWDHLSGPGHNSVTVSPDGKELLAVYHTHMDPAKGGGDRQMCFDRLGFREDGTLYVNGPSLSRMPRPSGSGPWGNIAGSAALTVSSFPEGARLLTDGAAGFYRKFAVYDWAARPEDQSPQITLSWDAPVKISAVLVYPGAANDAAPFSWSLSVDGKAPAKAARNLEFPPLPGAASILSFREIKARSLTISLRSLRDTANGYRLSEIVVLGRVP